jgi:ribonuclease Z
MLIRILPLGTSSAIANSTRNQSSLALILPTATTLLFDCGESTQGQLHKFRSQIKRTRIHKIFITHLHGDHVFGLCPLLLNIVEGSGGLIGTTDPRLAGTTDKLKKAKETEPAVEIFGPVGLRAFVRANLQHTYAILNGWIRIIELHPARSPDGTLPDPSHDAYVRELPGYNLLPNEGKCWTDILKTPEYTVSAGPITHSCPSVGYVVQLANEKISIPQTYRDTILEFSDHFKSCGINQPLSLLRGIQNNYDADPEIPKEVLSEEGIHLPNGRLLPRLQLKRGKKITILGDTCDPSHIASIARGSDVLVHEATNAYLPELDSSLKESDTYEVIEHRTISRGHSTPEMAGRFAALIELGKKQGRDKKEDKGVLVLNHFSSRYEDDYADGEDGRSMKIMTAIKQCAEKGWKEAVEGNGEQWMGRVVCARDGVEVQVR